MARIPRDLTANAWTRARARRGEVPLDLTVTNPTACGFAYPAGLLDALGDPRGLVYRPDPRGLREAREAIARTYAARGAAVDPERIVLASSSSEAYGFLFKLLCEPGDRVLVPAPSYPLFEHLARLEGVRPEVYRLDPAHAWQPELDEQIEGAKALVLVHPNNPTGTWVDEAAIGDALPLIVDEVFLDFPLATPAPRSFAARDLGLTFALGGLSKSRGLPQLKLSWIVVGGAADRAAAALEGLEFIADAYLSVATPIQLGLAEILREAAPVRDAILARCRENLRVAAALARTRPGIELATPDAGWSAVFRYPNVVPEETLVLELLEREGVAIHPGYFFDFETDGWVVASLIVPPDRFESGLGKTFDAIARRL
ncbi:MAG TPA: pyridoxal phosphate-dependent aminotransferase [Candidatus Polarisedimenticolaceae bacterium]|nr:pyridoxal phosphate-dependent aminotransferase [Candidatus Polarisedimenticolaceae bacterium]